MTDSEYNYPLLKKYLNKFYLERVGCYITWGWNDASSIGLTEPEIISIVEPKIKKADKYIQKKIDELWLLIVSGHRLSQQMGLGLSDKLNGFAQLNSKLEQSAYGKVYIYQYMHNVVYEWPGWIKYGREHFQ
ncbi:MAG: hypothetical protein AB1393_13045 [Candidatus Edwardsbacteria bacterium]